MKRRCFVCEAEEDFAHGYGSYCGPGTNNTVIYLCHPNDPELPDCYTLFCRSMFY